MTAAALVALATAAACSPPEAETKTAEATPPAAATEPAAPAAEAPAAETPAADAPAAAAAAVALVELDVTDASGAKLSGDPAAGERVFRQCQACHSIQAGQNRVGPTLAGIIGRTAGTVPGFNYSEANRSSGKVWTEQAMFEYLENPRASIPGTTMAFAGLRQPQQRADVIAYIQTHGGQ